MGKDCYGCPDRTVGCHGKCKDYAERQEKDVQRRKAQWQESETNAATFDGAMRRVKNSKKKK